MDESVSQTQAEDDPDVQEAHTIPLAHGDSSTEQCPGSGVPPPQTPTGGGASVDGGSRNGEPGSRANDTCSFPEPLIPTEFLPLGWDDLQSPLGRAPFISKQPLLVPRAGTPPPRVRVRTNG